MLSLLTAPARAGLVVAGFGLALVADAAQAGVNLLIVAERTLR